MFEIVEEKHDILFKKIPRGITIKFYLNIVFINFKSTSDREKSNIVLN